MLDYETLRVTWWVLTGVLLIGFAITDGFDLGVGALLTLVGRSDEQRRVMINTIGPTGTATRYGSLPREERYSPRSHLSTLPRFQVFTSRWV
jgi:hypothetical protein